MAVDTSMYAADIPAGTYSKGDVVNLSIVAGPANVRSGRGSAILKQIFIGTFTVQGGVYWRIHIKNSDWVDEVASIAAAVSSPAALDDHSGLVQFGCDNNLTQNSGWVAYAECVSGGTTTGANSVFALIDIDYPSVSSIIDPDALIGIPTSIDYDLVNAPIHAYGSMVGATWSIFNVDYFKAGYQYCLQAVEMLCVSVGISGFIALSSAAGMGGLQRIIPVDNDPSHIRAKIRYASKLSKGPMDVKFMGFSPTATSADVVMVHDYVKKVA